MINQSNFNEIYETFIKIHEGNANYPQVGLGFTAHKRSGSVGGPPVSEEEARQAIVEALKGDLAPILALMGRREEVGSE